MGKLFLSAAKASLVVLGRDCVQFGSGVAAEFGADAVLALAASCVMVVRLAGVAT